MTELVALRGLPGAGKTTMAREWVSQDMDGRVRVNRDDLRGMLHAMLFTPDVTEQAMTAARDGMIREMLAHGISVIVDDTNLPRAAMDRLHQLARECGAKFTVLDLTHIPVETCITQDAERDRPVGERKIRDLHEKYVKFRGNR